MKQEICFGTEQNNSNTCKPYNKINLDILGYLRLSRAILGYLGPSRVISGNLMLSQAISIYVYHVSCIRVQVEVGESKFLLFETFCP